MILKQMTSLLGARRLLLYSGTGLIQKVNNRFFQSTSVIGVEAKTKDISESEAAQANRAARIQLAAAYRGLEKLGLNEGVCNHLTLITSAANGNGEVMLVVPFGVHWSEVTASSLVGTNRQGEVVEGEGSPEISAACIHIGVRFRYNHKCVMHTHAPYATALACLKSPELTMTHQNAMRFYNKLAYDTHFEGPGNSMEEGRRLGSVLGEKEVLFMGNHGVITTGNSVAMAFDSMYYIERVAMFQMLAMSTGKDLRHIPEHVCQQYVEHYNAERLDEYAEANFQAMVRRLRRENPDFVE